MVQQLKEFDRYKLLPGCTKGWLEIIETTEEEQFAEQLTGRMPIQKFLKEVLLDKVNEAVLFITITDSLCVHLNTKFSYKALALRHHNMPRHICAEGDLPERERIRKSMQQHLEAIKQL
ncbi:hypothetical protein EAH_00039160 [Eimeria acervulina]|uniref:Uncharacterized protein n=1 Tax=Eimeria acervulina TaxID=5801 RepID=U6GHJ0_EIMAC|nr:hypothetical protein EAH_00039160 [Eimeria acervulina]CDI79012.1 hypothetical protein EAH_00039160 [Eimeria acervulina]